MGSGSGKETRKRRRLWPTRNSVLRKFQCEAWDLVSSLRSLYVTDVRPALRQNDRFRWAVRNLCDVVCVCRAFHYTTSECPTTRALDLLEGRTFDDSGLERALKRRRRLEPRLFSVGTRVRIGALAERVRAFMARAGKYLHRRTQEIMSRRTKIDCRRYWLAAETDVENCLAAVRARTECVTREQVCVAIVAVDKRPRELPADQRPQDLPATVWRAVATWLSVRSGVKVSCTALISSRVKVASTASGRKRGSSYTTTCW